MDQQPNMQPKAAAPSTHYRSFWPLTIIATIAIIVAGGLVWVMYNQGLSDDISAMVFSNHKQTEKVINSEQSQISSGWKIYKNDQYGFEAKYLDGWQISTTPDSVSFRPSSGSGVEINIFSKGNADNIETWLNKEYKNEIDFSRTKIDYYLNPNNVTFAQLKSVPGESSDNAASYAIHQNYVFVIMVTTYSKLSKEYSTMLGSFKFIK